MADKKEKWGMKVVKLIIPPKKQAVPVDGNFVSMDSTNMLEIENRRLRQRVHELEMKLLQMGKVV